MPNAAPDLGGHGLIARFIRHKNAANLVMVLMILSGIYALAKLNTQFFPTAEIRTITVSVIWPGASAQDVEQRILNSVEPAVRFLDGVDQVISIAREGAANIVLEFDPSTDMQKALSDADSAVAAINTLPEEAERPKVTLRRFYDRIAKLSVSGPYSERALKVFAKRIRDDLIDRGVDRIEMNGFRDEEIVVRVPQAELRRLELTASDVAGRIRLNTQDRPSGNIRGSIDRQVRATAEGETPEAISRIEIKTFPTGERVRIRDVGRISYELDSDQPRGIVNGRPAIQLTVMRAENADTLKSNEILTRYLEEAKAKFPPSLEIRKYQVNADRLLERIMLLVKNGFTGLVLVVAVLLVFLNGRVAIWVAVGIPVSMMATLGMMYFSGQTINMISLFALLMTLGIIVDDAIVVGEHTATRFSMGDPPALAAETGAGRMMVPVVAASLTTIAAFAPIFLVSGVMGQIIVALPMVVIVVLTASLVECFFVLPGHLAHSLGGNRRASWSWWRVVFIALAILSVPVLLDWFVRLFVTPEEAKEGLGLLLSGTVERVRDLVDTVGAGAPPLKIAAGAAVVFAVLFLAILVEAAVLVFKRRANRNPHGESRFRRAFDAGFGWFRDKPFNFLVGLSYRWRYATVALAVSSVLIFAVGNWMGGRIGFQFFPSPEAESLTATIEFNSGIPEEEAVVAIRRIEASLFATEKQLSGDGESLIVSAYTTLGQSGRHQGGNLAEVNVDLTASEVRTVRTFAFINAWRRNLPHIVGIKRIAVSARRGGPPGKDIDIRLIGGDSATLKKAALEAADLLSAFPGVSAVSDDLPFGKPELVLRLTPRGKALGFTLEDVGKQIRDAFEGAIARRMAVGDEEVEVKVKTTSAVSGGEQVRVQELKSPSGTFVPLNEIVHIAERQVFSVVQRRDGHGSVSVTGDVDDKVTSNQAVIAKLSEKALPDLAAKYGITYKFSGRAEERANAFADLGLGLILALSVIYIILAWIFSSYWRPLAVMLIIPFGVVGTFIGHDLMGYKLTMMSFISLLGLAGILVNDSIVLVSRLDERLGEGEDLEVAAVGASRDRLRAVLLTSLTTIGGLAPLLFEQSLQAQFLKPMAITIVFGLSVATLWVLFLVPSIVGIGGDISRFLRGIYGPRDEAGVMPAE